MAEKLSNVTPVSLTNIMMGLLTAGVVSWGGVIWSLGTTAIEQLDALNARVAVLEVTVKLAAEHVKIEAEDEATRKLNEISEKLEALLYQMRKNEKNQ